MISSSQRPLPDNTQHSQQTDIRAPGGIRTHNLSRPAVADLRLQPRGHWDRLCPLTLSKQNIRCPSSLSTRECLNDLTYFTVLKNVKWFRYRPGVAQRVGRVIALLFHDHGTRRGMSGQQDPPAALYRRERTGTHFTGGWVCPRAGLDGRKISSPPGFDPGSSSS